MPYDEPYKPADNTSETPSTLVAPGSKRYEDGIWYVDYEYRPNEPEKWNLRGHQVGKLSPNPARFGFSRQLFFEKLNTVSDASKDANTLYIVPYRNANNEVVEYYKYRYDLVTRAFVRVVEVEPQNETKKGTSVQSKDAAIVNNAPKVEDPFYSKINLGIKLGLVDVPQQSGGSTVKQELVAIGKIEEDGDLCVQGAFGHFTPEQENKIDGASLLIFTYANSFILTPLSQTGEARTVGNIIYDDSGNGKVGKVKFTYTKSGQFVPQGYLFVQSDVHYEFSDPNNTPIAYLFAVTF